MPHQCTECGHVFPDGSKEMLGGCPDCGGNKFQFHKGGIPEESVPEESPPSRPGEDSHVANAVGKAADAVRGFVGKSREPPEVERDAPRADAEAGDDAVETEQATLDAVTADATGDASASGSDDETDETGDAGDRTRLRPEGEWPETARPPEHGDAEGEVAESDADAAEVDAAGGVEPSPEGAVGPSADLDDAETVEADAVGVEAGASGEDRAQADARSAMVDDDDLPAGASGGDGRVVGEPSGDRPDLAALREELNDQFESIKVVAPGRYELNLMELYDREEYIIAIQENGKYVIEVPDAWDETE